MAPNQRSDPGAEAWALFFRLFLLNKPRMMALAQELDLAPMQLNALRVLGESDEERTMSSLASALVCDPSNVTGIVDRLVARGLLERREAAHDRRVKLLSLTDEGKRVREQIVSRLGSPPPTIAGLSRADQVALRDLLQRALDTQEAAPADPRPA
jgi:DNA-binding MarR family transcriptional regulator